MYMYMYMITLTGNSQPVRFRRVQIDLLKCRTRIRYSIETLVSNIITVTQVQLSHISMQHLKTNGMLLYTFPINNNITTSKNPAVTTSKNATVTTCETLVIISEHHK